MKIEIGEEMKLIFIGIILLLLINGCFVAECGNLVGPPTVPLKIYKIQSDFFDSKDVKLNKVINSIDSAYIKHPFLNPIDSKYRKLTSLNSYKLERVTDLTYIFCFQGYSNKWIAIKFKNDPAESIIISLKLMKPKVITEQYSNSEWDTVQTKINFSKFHEIKYRSESIGRDSTQVTFNIGYFYDKCGLTEKERNETINSFEKNIIPYLDLGFEAIN